MMVGFAFLSLQYSQSVYEIMLFIKSIKITTGVFKTFHTANRPYEILLWLYEIYM